MHVSESILAQAELPASDDIALCERAIETYLNALHGSAGIMSSRTVSANHLRAKKDAPKLAQTRGIGIEVGGPGCATVRLMYTGARFFLQSGGMSCGAFEKWNKEIEQAFANAGLPFRA